MSVRSISSTRRSFAGPHAQSPDLLKRQFSRNLRTLDPRGKHTERTFVLIYPWYNTARARGLPARRRGRICAQYRARDAGKAVANRRPDRRAHHSRLRPPAHAPAPSALRPSLSIGRAPELRDLRAAHTGGGCERRAQVACGRGDAKVGGVRGEIRAAAAP